MLKKKPDVVKYKFKNDDELLKEIGRGYYDKPVEFAESVLNFTTLDDGQKAVLRAIAKHDRVGVKGANGIGKSLVLAIALLWFLATRPDCKVVTTSGSMRQVKRSLWSEVHALHEHSIIKSCFNLLRTDLERVGREAVWFATGFTTDTAGAMEGWHSKNILFIVDEGRAVPDDMWQAVLKGSTTPGAKIIAGSIPGASEGYFYKIFTNLSRQWKCFSFPSAVYKYGKYRAIYPQRVSLASILEKLNEGGEDSPFFRSSVLAEFVTSAEDSLITASWVAKCRGNVLDASGASVFGLDVARFGSDMSCLAERQGPVIMGFKERHGLDTVSCTTWAELEIEGKSLAIDGCGIGGAIVDNLVARGKVNATDINVAKASSDPERFVNLRAELAWKLRNRFEKNDIDLSRLSEGVYEKLKTQLTSVKYKFQAGKLLIESKEDMKRKGIASPDLVDALILAFACDDTGQGGFDWSANDRAGTLETSHGIPGMDYGRPSTAGQGDW